MDMVLDIAPATSQEKRSASKRKKKYRVLDSSTAASPPIDSAVRTLFGDRNTGVTGDAWEKAEAKPFVQLPGTPSTRPERLKMDNSGGLHESSCHRITMPSLPSTQRGSPPVGTDMDLPQTHGVNCLDGVDPVMRLAIQCYIAISTAPAHGQSPEVLGPAHVFKAFGGMLAQGSHVPEVLWLNGHPELEELALRAFRYALKVTVDVVAMAEDAADMEDSELEAELRKLDDEWHLGRECSPSWQAAMKQKRPNLMALRKHESTSAYQVLILRLKEDKVQVGDLRPEVVQSIWAAASLELRYFTNDDDERYSIQAHPTLLRNMIVQTAEYPIFTSPPITLWF
jgi:hypothetical protein